MPRSTHTNQVAVGADPMLQRAPDSTKDVREVRLDDTARVAAKWERVANATTEESRDEAEIEAGLLSALGVAP